MSAKRLRHADVRDASETALPLRVETITDEQGLLALEPAWNALLEESDVDHPFLSHEWVRTWWECFGADQQLHVLVVKEGDRLIALLPLMRSVGRLYGQRVRRLESIGNAHTQRIDVIAHRRRPEVYRAIWGALLRQRELWDVLVLSQLPAGSPTLKELTGLAREDGFLTGLWRSAESPYIRMEGGWDAYLEKLAPKHRANLRRRSKRLGQLGDVQLEVVASESDVDAALAEGFRLEAAGWKGSAGTAIVTDPATRRFYSSLAQRAARRGWLRLHFLRVGGQRIAFDFSLLYANKAYMLKPAYDPKYAVYSPYSQLLFRALKDNFEGGVREFDFLGQDEAWKLDWASRTRPHEWLYVLPNSRRMRMVRFAKFKLLPNLKRHPTLAAVGAAARAVAGTLSTRSRRPPALDEHDEN